MNSDILFEDNSHNKVSRTLKVKSSSELMDEIEIDLKQENEELKERVSKL